MALTLPRDWREKQKAEIAQRDERSARRREDIKKQANESIDEFYIEHKARVERNIKENKCVMNVSVPRAVD